jgi:hypothetical protein
LLQHLTCLVGLEYLPHGNAARDIRHDIIPRAYHVVAHIDARVIQRPYLLACVRHIQLLLPAMPRVLLFKRLPVQYYLPAKRLVFALYLVFAL